MSISWSRRCRGVVASGAGDGGRGLAWGSSPRAACCSLALQSDRNQEVGLDFRLIEKGRRQPREGLVQQARVHLELARRHEERLKLFGWTPADTDRLATALSLLESELARQADERGMSRQATRNEQRAIDEAKAFVRKLRLSLPRVLRQTSVSGVGAESFAVQTRLRRNTPQILAYLTRIQPAVERLDDELALHFGGVRPSERLQEVKARLEAADTEQEALWAKLPHETARVYEAKGRVLELIEDLNRAGKSAFDDDPETAALFNKALIARGRRKRSERRSNQRAASAE